MKGLISSRGTQTLKGAWHAWMCSWHVAWSDALLGCKECIITTYYYYYYYLYVFIVFVSDYRVTCLGRSSIA
jgi:hypothetical protein